MEGVFGREELEPDRPLVTVKCDSGEIEAQRGEGLSQGHTASWCASKDQSSGTLTPGPLALVQDPLPSFPLPASSPKQCEIFSKHLCVPDTSICSAPHCGSC